MPRPVAQGKASRVADARATNLVDRLAPPALLPYLRLARVDRPTGCWLLAIPCFWSLALASRSIGADYPDAWLLVLFAIGAVVMRAAGCTYNDIIDKDIDAKVARTQSRPLPSGEISEKSATIFMLVLHDRACGASLLQCRDRLARALRGSAGGALPSGEALQSLAASGAWACLQLGCSARLFRRARTPRIAGGRPLRWSHRLDHRLRHHLRPSRPRRRRAGRAQIDRAQIRAGDQGLALRLLRACLARDYRGRAPGRGRDRVPAWHGGCGCPSLLASGHARYRRPGQLPAALQVEPRFRVDRIRGHRARSGSRFAVLETLNEPGPRGARPGA